MYFNDNLTLGIYHIEDIGKLNYSKSILLGKNKRIRRFNLKIEGEESLDKDLNGNFIATITNSCLIITDFVNGKRIPIIVRKWRKVKQLSMFKNKDYDYYNDVDGNNWIYSRMKGMSDILSTTIEEVSIMITFR